MFSFCSSSPLVLELYRELYNVFFQTLFNYIVLMCFQIYASFSFIIRSAFLNQIFKLYCWFYSFLISSLRVLFSQTDLLNRAFKEFFPVSIFILNLSIKSVQTQLNVSFSYSQTSHSKSIMILESQFFMSSLMARISLLQCGRIEQVERSRDYYLQGTNSGNKSSKKSLISWMSLMETFLSFRLWCLTVQFQVINLYIY